MVRWLVNFMIASMVFFPAREFSMRPGDLGLTAEDAWCMTEDGVRIHGWFIRASGTNLCLLFFHGNADNISIRLPKAHEWIRRGVSVFLVDYRGYGQSEGEIKKGDDLFQDAQAAFRWLRDEKSFQVSQIILYGESIGAAPAIELAAGETFKAVILEAPFTSLKELAKHHYGWVPDFLLKDFVLDNESKISRLRSPIFILHGTDDEIVPFTMGQRLFEQAPEPKKLLEIQGAHHNDIALVGAEHFFEEPFRFVVAQ